MSGFLAGSVGSRHAFGSVQGSQNAEKVPDEGSLD